MGAGIPSGAPQAQEASGTKISASLAMPEDELDELDEELDEELEEDEELELDELEELVRPDDELEDELDEELLELEELLEELVVPPQPDSAAKVSTTLHPSAAVFVHINFCMAGMVMHPIMVFIENLTGETGRGVAQLRAQDHK